MKEEMIDNMVREASKEAQAAIQNAKNKFGTSGYTAVSIARDSRPVPPENIRDELSRIISAIDKERKAAARAAEEKFAGELARRALTPEGIAFAARSRHVQAVRDAGEGPEGSEQRKEWDRLVSAGIIANWGGDSSSED